MTTDGAPAPRGHARWRILRWSVRVGGLVVLAFLLQRATGGLAKSARLLQDADGALFGAAWAIYLAGLLLSAVRLRGLVRAAGHAGAVWPLFADVLRATALNALITVGSGEVYRIARLREGGLDTGSASALVLVDRVTGLAVVATAGLVGLSVFGAEQTGWSLPGPLLAGLAAVVGGATWWIGRVTVARYAPAALPFFSRPRVAATALALSVGMLLTWVLSVALLARALGLDVDPRAIAFAAPVVAVATLLPVSVGGIGVREAGYAVLLAPYGVMPEQAVALGLLQYLGYLVVAGIGGVLLAAGRGPLRLGGRAGRVADELGVDA
jgi:uncharacterized membrane protein YbhN (UPF0104 family)